MRIKLHFAALAVASLFVWNAASAQDVVVREKKTTTKEQTTNKSTTTSKSSGSSQKSYTEKNVGKQKIQNFTEKQKYTEHNTQGWDEEREAKRIREGVYDEHEEVVTPEMVAQNAGSAFNRGDYAEAFSLYTQAANDGNSYSQCMLGYMYENGVGVTRDLDRAVSWYEKAAYQGLKEAQFNLGNMYYMGKGVTQNKETARSWWRKAADQGYPQAQQYLDQLQ